MVRGVALAIRGQLTRVAADLKSSQALFNATVEPDEKIDALRQQHSTRDCLHANQGALLGGRADTHQY